MDYYTYAYLREDGTPYYIGKGKSNRIHSKLHSINLPPQNRRIYLKKNLTAKEAVKHEIYMISVLGRKDIGTGILRNLTDGGEGVPGRIFSEETRKKISDRIKEYERTPEHQENISKSRRGKPISDYHRQRIVEGLKTRDQSGQKNYNYGRRWWNNGTETLMSVECPGEGFVLGRLYKKRLNNS